MSTSCVNFALHISEKSCCPRWDVASLSFVDNPEVATRLQYWHKKGNTVSCEIPREGDGLKTNKQKQQTYPPPPNHNPKPKLHHLTIRPPPTTHSVYLQKERDLCYWIHASNKSSYISALWTPAGIHSKLLCRNVNLHHLPTALR